MTDMDSGRQQDQTSDEVTVETTSVFRADFLNELDAPAQAGTESAVSGVEGLPAGSALLVAVIAAWYAARLAAVGLDR